MEDGLPSVSCEARADTSAWGVDILHSHVLTILNEREEKYAQRFRAIEEFFKEKFIATERAVSKAEIASEKRFDSVNEFRAQLTDQASTFLTRAESMQRTDTINEKITALEKRMDRGDGQGEGLHSGWGFIVGGVGVVAGVIGIISAILAFSK